MSTEKNRSQLSSLGGTVTICDTPDRDDACWVLRDEMTGEEISIWPSEVSELVELLKAFRMREGGFSNLDESTTPK